MYVTPYIEAFPNAKIMMRRPFKITKEIGFGLYNDMIGHDQSTRQWMEWIEQGGVYEQTQEDALVSMPAYWESAPAGGEFTSAIPMSQLLTTNLDRTLEMLKETHTSFIGPHIPRENGEDNGRLEEGIKNVLQSVGYRIGVTKVTWSVSVRSNTKVKLIWENNGVAPMYWNWPVYLYFVDQDNFILDKTPVSIALTDLLPGKIIKTVSKFELNDKRKNARSVYIGIEDPMTDEPTVKLVSNQDRNNNLSLIKRLN